MRDINVTFYLCLIFFCNKNYDLLDRSHKFAMRSSISVTITLILE